MTIQSNQQLTCRLQFVLHDKSNNPSIHTVSGQTARTLEALDRAGAAGITAAEVSTWAFRLAAYIHDLRKLGLDIEMVREPHSVPTGKGWHGRYILQTPVQIMRRPDKPRANRTARLRQGRAG